MSLSATIWSRLSSQIPMSKRVISQTQTVIKLPHGLATNGRDRRTELVNPIAVHETLYQVRKFLEHKPDKAMMFIKHQELGNNNHLRHFAGEFFIAKEMYNLSPKYPAEVEFSLKSYGESSVLLEYKLQSPNISHPVAVGKDKSVLVSDSFTEVLPLPQIWKDKFRSFHKKEDIWFEALSSPFPMVCRGARVKPFVLTVPMRDAGNHGYAVTHMLLQYCLDALGHHFYRNQIPFEGNIESFFLKKASYYVTSSARASDILTVELWDDEIYPDGVSFNIHKSGKSVFQSRIQFYSPGNLPLQSDCAEH